MNWDFNDIRPYNDSEVLNALNKIKNDPQFLMLTNFIWPQKNKKEIVEKTLKVQSIKDFQLEFMHEAIRTIISNTSKELTHSGFENLNKNDSYLFIANHRDILLDPAILQILLVEQGFKTSEIVFGSNLVQNDFIAEFVKLNKMITLSRDGTNKEIYETSQKLSAYIRHTITNKNESVWIAQRNGRTKNGNDSTQVGLLKMLNMSGNESFSENLKKLNIIPLSISYEFEPCDFLKVKEQLIINSNKKYIKAPGEDLISVSTGIQQAKGKIHLSVGNQINFEELNKFENENEKIKALANLIDKQIITNYKLWSNNYIAYDLLNHTNYFKNKYTEGEKSFFIEYIEKQAKNIDAEEKNIFNIFIEIYSSPLKNYLTFNKF